MSRGELHELLWPSTFVLETNLASLSRRFDARWAMRPMRRAFCERCTGSGTGSSATLTRPTRARHAWALSTTGSCGRGVRCGSLTATTCWAALPTPHVWIDAPGVSRHHARIVVSGAGRDVEDLGSKNGTYVRDRRVDAPLTLGDGDQIRLGSVVVTFRIPPVTGSTETAPAG